MATQCIGFTMTLKVFIFCVWTFFSSVTHLLLLLRKAVFYIKEKKKTPPCGICLFNNENQDPDSCHLQLVTGWFEKLLSPRVLSQRLLKCFSFGTIV